MGELLHFIPAIGDFVVFADTVVASCYPNVAIGVVNNIVCYESGLYDCLVIGVEAVNGIVCACPDGSVAVYVHVVHIVAHAFTCKRYDGDFISVKITDSIACAYPYQSVPVLNDCPYGV